MTKDYTQVLDASENRENLGDRFGLNLHWGLFVWGNSAEWILVVLGGGVLFGVEHLPHVVVLSGRRLLLLFLYHIHGLSSLHSDLVVFILKIFNFQLKFLV